MTARHKARIGNWSRIRFTISTVAIIGITAILATTSVNSASAYVGDESVTLTPGTSGMPGETGYYDINLNGLYGKYFEINPPTGAEIAMPPGETDYVCRNELGVVIPAGQFEDDLWCGAISSGERFGEYNVAVRLEAGTNPTPGSSVTDGSYATFWSSDDSVHLQGTLSYTVDNSVPAPVITTSSLPDGTVGVPYSTQLQASGAGVTWSASGLPDGLRVDATSGEIAGTPTKAVQAANVTVTATNSTGSDSASLPVTVHAAVVVTSPVAGSTVSSNRPTVSGTGEPGETVTVSNDATSLGSVDVDSDGSWSLRSTLDVPDGPVTVTAKQTVDGVTSTADRSFIVSNPLTVTAPAEQEVVRTSTPVISGTGIDGSVVEIRDEQGRNLLGEDGYTVPSKGVWSKPSKVALADGVHTITVTHRSGSQIAEVTRTFTVKSAAPVVFTSPVEGSNIPVRPTVSGTGEPGTTVTVTLDSSDGLRIGATEVDADGRWSLVSSGKLVVGKHVLVAVDSLGSDAQVTVQVQRAPQAQITVTPQTQMVTALPSYPAPAHAREAAK